jgi:RNA polymerase sigma factor (sigma-70 family)
MYKPGTPRVSCAPPPSMPDLSSLSSVDLLRRAQDGDAEALDLLFARYLPSLRRWASGRLPRWARDIHDTTDLVQDTLLQTCKRIELFDTGRDASLQAYLRQALLNRIRDEFRRRRRRPQREPEFDPERPADDPSPLDLAVAEEMLDHYEAALDRLSETDRELVVSRVQAGLSFEEIAEVTGKPTANAARTAVLRAVRKLAEEMGRG